MNSDRIMACKLIGQEWRKINGFGNIFQSISCHTTVVYWHRSAIPISSVAMLVNVHSFSFLNNFNIKSCEIFFINGGNCTIALPVTKEMIYTKRNMWHRASETLILYQKVQCRSYLFFVNFWHTCWYAATPALLQSFPWSFSTHSKGKCFILCEMLPCFLEVTCIIGIGVLKRVNKSNISFSFLVSTFYFLNSTLNTSFSIFCPADSGIEPNMKSNT